MSMWMDGPEGLKRGELVFIAQLYDGNNAIDWEVSRTAYQKNMSGEAVLRGWCGSTNNINCNADGMGVVRGLSSRLDDDGESIPRYLIERLRSSNPRVITLCEELGVTV